MLHLLLADDVRAEIAQRLFKLTDQVNDTAGVSPLVVVPGNELDEVLVEGNTCGSIEDAGVRIAVQVGGDKGVFGVIHDT